ncbi:MAG: TonB-dependent siderophore receptor [Rhizobacter sp.]
MPARSSHPLPRLMAVATQLALAGLLTSPVALVHAQTEPVAQAARAYDIPPGPLAATLNRFAEQSGIYLAATAELTQGKTSPGLRGSYSVTDALPLLLQGTGLVAAFQNNGAYSLVKRAEPGTTEATLPAVKVRATAVTESATGPVDGYVAKRSATATKTDTPLIETPQSITVVSADQIRTLQAQNLVEALGYSAGVLRDEGADRTGDGFVIRGFGASAFSGSVYRDGSKYQANFYNGQQELYGLERVEVLKGAASVLYGNAGPGGVINTVSKRPTLDPLRELNVEYGSFNRKQVSGDFGGALTSGGALSFRLTALHRKSDTFIDHVPDDRTYIAPALKWQPSAATSLTLLSEYQQDLTTYVYALPPEGTILPNINGPIARNRFVGEPGYDKYDNKRYSVGYLLEHSFNDGLQLRHSLRGMRAHNNFPSVWIAGLEVDERTTAYRGAQDREDTSATYTTDTSLQAKWNGAGIAHTTVVGFDYTVQKTESERYNRDALPIDLYNPIYGVPLLPPNSDYLWTVKSKRLGLYAQEQMKIADKWVAMLGLRQDWGRYSEAEDPIGAPMVWKSDNEKSDALTGRAGVVYLADNGLAPFVSFSQSFEPMKGQDRLDSRFKPTLGEQYELGLRYQPPGTDTMLSVAVYQLTQQNVLVTDPVDPTESVQMGEVRSRGIELEAKTRIGRTTNLVAAYAYTDARTIKSSPLTPEAEGKRSGGVPYNQFSFWADSSFGLPGFKAGGGVRHVGSTVGTWIDGQVPAYTLFDTMVSYTFGSWKVALNATNLADKTYVASCTYGCFYGEPRKIIGTLTYRW